MKAYLLESGHKKMTGTLKDLSKIFMIKSLKTYTKIFTQDLQSENVLRSEWY